MRRTLLRVGLFMILTAASFTGSSLWESPGAIAAPVLAGSTLLNPVVSAATLTPAALLCVGFCCSGSVTGSGSFDLFGFQYAFLDVVVTCSDGSSCTGRFELYGVGDIYELTFVSNC